MSRTSIALVAFTLATLLAGSAHAQGWLADRQRTEGPGFRVGNLELHPGLGAEVGYDSNAFLEDQGANDTGIFRLTAHLLASTLGEERKKEGEGEEGQDQQTIAFRGGLNISYVNFFEDRPDDNVSGGLNGNLTILPGGTFSMDIHESFQRTIRPFADDGPGADFGRNRNVAGVDFKLRSKGGVLEGSFGYENVYEFFDDALFNFADSITHRVKAGMNWRFLPNTALIQRNVVSIQDYNNVGPDPASQLSDNIRLRSNIGINGAITNTFSVGAFIGYGAGFFDQGDDYESVNARVEARWSPKETLQISGGYARRFRSSFIGNFNKSDRLYLKSEMMFGGAFLLGAEGSVSFDETGVALAADGSDLGSEGKRESIRVKASLFAEYRFTDWLALNTEVAYRADFTDFQFNDPMPGGMSLIPDPGSEYQQFEVWGGIRAFY